MHTGKMEPHRLTPGVRRLDNGTLVYDELSDDPGV
jgi:hypothetical protein